MQTTLQRIPNQRQKCKGLWIEFYKNVTAMTLQWAVPAQGKPYSEPTITVNGQRLQVVDKFNYLGSTPQHCTLMMRLLLKLRKQVWHLVNSTQMSGSGMESDLTLSSKSTRLWYCQPSYIHVRCIPTSCQETEPFPLKLPEKNS